MAKPATTTKAIEAARRRRTELLGVLTLRGKPFDRDKLTEQERCNLENGPYPAAAAAYLATHEKWFWQAARKIEARHVPLEDVVQATRIGGLRALDKFDRGLVDSGAVTSFLSYARWWVRCEIGKLLDDESLVKISAAAKKTTTELRQRIERHAELIGTAPESLSDDEVAAALGLPLEKVKLYRNLHLGHEHYDVSTTSATPRDRARSKCDDEDTVAGVVAERLQELSDEIDDDVQTKLRGSALDVAVAKLPPLHRRVLSEQFGLELDKEAASVRLPVSQVACAAIAKAAMGRVRAAMGDWEALGR